MNPYESPKSEQEPPPVDGYLFERIQGYQQLGLYLGFALAIGSAILAATTEHPMLIGVMKVTGAIGGIMIVLCIASILPLLVWGFFSGYLEGRRKGKR